MVNAVIAVTKQQTIAIPPVTIMAVKHSIVVSLEFNFLPAGMAHLNDAKRMEQAIKANLGAILIVA